MKLAVTRDGDNLCLESDCIRMDFVGKDTKTAAFQVTDARTQPDGTVKIELTDEQSALRAYDAECRDVFIYLYWGYRSPWWLLHGDVLFEPGLDIEAASPSGSPTLYARDGVTVGLDQAQWWCHDLPKISKDSLGVWLSDWRWNSCIGTERWEEAFVMDICRGSLLAQPWSDREFLDPVGRRRRTHDMYGCLSAWYPNRNTSFAAAPTVFPGNGRSGAELLNLKSFNEVG